MSSRSFWADAFRGLFGGSEISIAVPTLNANLVHLDAMFKIFETTERELEARPGSHVSFDFSGCKFLQQNAVIFLGGLARLIQHRGGSVTFRWETLDGDVRKNLTKNGFMAAFGGNVGPRGSTIPYREHRTAAKEAVVSFLRSEWLDRGWVKMTEAVQDAVLGNVWELYANAFEHSHSPIGVFSCGQYYPNMRIVKLAIGDFGVGIPDNVRRFKSRASITAANALKWAFQAGTSTLQGQNAIARGLGLATVTELVRANAGKLEMFSNEGHFVLDSKGEHYRSRSANFRGTMVTIQLNCDSLLYCFDFETRRRRRAR